MKPATKSPAADGATHAKQPATSAVGRPLNIGEAARASGVSARMIRHYEQTGLLPEAQRSMSGYRQYGPSDLHTLRFIQQARQLGFGIGQIAVLLDLWRDRDRPSAEVKALAQSHIAELDEKIAEMQQMRATLAALSHACHGDDRPDCPILEGLAGPHCSAQET